MVISGGFDPLLGIAYKRQIYPPNLAPKFITKYFKAGFFIELTAGIPLSVSFKGKHWPDTGKSEWKEVEVKGSGKIGIALSLELKLAKAKNAELVEGAIVGESGMEFEFSGVMREPEVKFQAKFPGIKGKATIKIWSGWVELNREFQLVAEHPFEPHIWKLGE